jgi:hypothetical protein
MQFIDLLNVQELRNMFEDRFQLEQEIEALRLELERVRRQRNALTEELEESRTLLNRLNSRLLALEALDRTP